jgi:hypothetical protein
MSMQTIVLGDQTAAMTVGGLIEQAARGSLEIRDAAGKVVAYVLSPADEQAWAYAKARVYFENHREEFEAAAKRRDGITTSELLAKAAVIAGQSTSSTTP